MGTSQMDGEVEAMCAKTRSRKVSILEIKVSATSGDERRLTLCGQT